MIQCLISLGCTFRNIVLRFIGEMNVTTKGNGVVTGRVLGKGAEVAAAVAAAATAIATAIATVTTQARGEKRKSRTNRNGNLSDLSNNICSSDIFYRSIIRFTLRSKCYI